MSATNINTHKKERIWFKFSFLSFPHKLMVLPMMVVVIQQNQVSISVTKWKEDSLLPTS